jgi:hypothetical protein
MAGYRIVLQICLKRYIGATKPRNQGGERKDGPSLKDSLPYIQIFAQRWFVDERTRKAEIWQRMVEMSDNVNVAINALLEIANSTNETNAHLQSVAREALERIGYGYFVTGS